MPLILARIPYCKFSFKDCNMSNNNLKQEEFKVVTYKKKRAKTASEINFGALIEPAVSECFDLDFEIKRIKAAKEDLTAADVYSSILASLREGLDILHKPTVKEIVCFGLGRIGECMIARYQLALLLCLRDLYQVQAFVYDPIFNENDHRILSAFDFNVLHNNNEGKYSVKEKNTTLFYLPHCPKQLTNNLLWANWGLQLSYCVIIANSFTKIIESNSKRHITENAGYILNASPYVTELAVVNSFKYYEIFNDTAIHIFPWDDIRLISQDFWQYNAEPKYSSHDIEFISNKLSNDLKL